MKSPRSKSFFFSFLIVAALCSFNVHNDDHLATDVLTETNAFRKTKGLAPLETNETLNAIALEHSENMAKGRVGFGHSGFEKRNGLALKKITMVSSFAENVAFGATTAKDAVLMWKNSEGHRRNMLGRFRLIGIGVAKDKQGRVFYTQVFAG